MRDGFYSYDTPWASAGVFVKDGKIIDAAPIYRKMIGWSASVMKKYSYTWLGEL